MNHGSVRFGLAFTIHAHDKCALTSSYEHSPLSPVVLPLFDRPSLFFLLCLHNRLFQQKAKTSTHGNTKRTHEAEGGGEYALALLQRDDSTGGKECVGHAPVKPWVDGACEQVFHQFVRARGDRKTKGNAGVLGGDCDCQGSVIV